MSFLRRIFAKISMDDSPSADAFGRMRVSNSDTIFDSNFQYDLQPLIYEAKVANSATVTHTPAKSSATIATAASVGSSAILQTRQYHRYISGKSQLLEMTQVLGAAVSGIVRRAGLFDVDDGIFLEQNGVTDVAFTLRTSTSGSPSDSNRVVQANWSEDTFDGSGNEGNPSGILLDLSKSQILCADLQWLGMGRVRVGFNINGVWQEAHRFNNANNLSVPYMKTANLPVRWEAVGNGVSTMLATCAVVESEGGADRFSSYRFAYARPVVTAGSGSQTYAFSIRPKATFNSLTNRILLRPTALDCLATGNNPVLVELYYGTAVGGSPSWTDMDASYSGLQVDIAGTPSGGLKVGQLWVPASAAAGAIEKALSLRYPLTLDIAGTAFTHFTVYVTGIGGTSACYPGLHWEEVR